MIDKTIPMQEIDVSTAAHNIAKIFTQEYLKSLDNKSALDLNTPQYFDAVNEVSNLYANTYDIAFKCISDLNAEH